MSDHYTTKDTGEALAMRLCRVKELRDPYEEPNGFGGKNIFFTFEDSQQREDVTVAYFGQMHRHGLGHMKLYDAELAEVVCEVVKERKVIMEVVRKKH